MYKQSPIRTKKNDKYLRFWYSRFSVFGGCSNITFIMILSAAIFYLVLETSFAAILVLKYWAKSAILFASMDALCRFIHVSGTPRMAQWKPTENELWHLVYIPKFSRKCVWWNSIYPPHSFSVVLKGSRSWIWILDFKDSNPGFTFEFKTWTGSLIRNQNRLKTMGVVG